MAKKPLPSSSVGRRHGVLPTYSLVARLAQGLTNEQATSSLVNKHSNRQIYKMTAVKQEEVDTASDISGDQIIHDEPLCHKHNKPYEYIHRPRKTSSIRKFEGKKIHLKPIKYILREKFVRDGKRMYFSVPFSTGSLFPHMDADRGELPITIGDGTIVDKRSIITKGWSNFFPHAHMNKGQAYAFAFKCAS